MTETYYRIYDTAAGDYLDANYDNVEDANNALMDWHAAFIKRDPEDLRELTVVGFG